VLGPSEGGLGGQGATDGFAGSGRNAYPSGAKASFADVACLLVVASLFALLPSTSFQFCLLALYRYSS